MDGGAQVSLLREVEAAQLGLAPYVSTLGIQVLRISSFFIVRTSFLYLTYYKRK
jgi:hypothetical protein